AVLEAQGTRFLRDLRSTGKARVGGRGPAIITRCRGADVVALGHGDIGATYLAAAAAGPILFRTAATTVATAGMVTKLTTKLCLRESQIEEDVVVTAGFQLTAGVIAHKRLKPGLAAVDAFYFLRVVCGARRCTQQDPHRQEEQETADMSQK